MIPANKNKYCSRCKKNTHITVKKFGKDYCGICGERIRIKDDREK
jgi:rRNA maturation endonuclease Nob1